MIVGWLSLTVFADPPDRTVRLWKVGDRTGGYVERIALSADNDIVVGRTRADQKAWLFDVDGWAMFDFAGGTGESACRANGAAAVIAAPGSDWTHEIWLACDNGTVAAWAWNGFTVDPLLDPEGVQLTLDVDDQLESVFWDEETQLLYAVSVPGGEVPARVHVVDIYALTVDAAVSTSFPKDMPYALFGEGVIVDGYLISSHGGQNMSSLALGLGSSGVIPNTFTTAFHCNDLAPSPLGGVYCVDYLGTVAAYQPLTNILNVLPLGVLSEPKAVCANPDLQDGWLAVTGNRVQAWQMDPTGAIDTADGPYFQGPEDQDNPIEDMRTSEGYIWGGGIAGNLHIVTSKPWAYPAAVTASPATAAAGAKLTFTYQFDQDVDWEIRVGGDRNGGGKLLAEGSVPAEVTKLEVLEVDDRFEEGVNFLYIFGTNARNLVGHGRTAVVVDNPPKPPTLGVGSVDFDEGALSLSFAGIQDNDLTRYEIWVSEKPFSGDDYAAGGPEWDGGTRLETPIVVNAAPGQQVTRRIAPLENDVTYYIGVRAWDAAGKEGPMSKVVSGTPRQVYTAAELAGDEGGAPCSTGPSSPLGAAAVGLAAFLARRRRSTAAIAVAVGLAVLPGAASAADDEDHWWRQDTTPARADFELRYGVVDLVDEKINGVYSRNPHNLLQVEMGPQFYRFAEVDFGFGFFQELAFAVDDSFASSGQRTMLTWYPLALDGTLRAHFVDEQPVVPFARYGWDYLIWSEKADAQGGGKDTVAGASFGTHWALGANILLDLFQPGRASFLEAQTGINDSWLTLEWRRQRIDARERPWSGRTNPDDKLDFSGDAFTLGFKLDW